METTELDGLKSLLKDIQEDINVFDKTIEDKDYFNQNMDLKPGNLVTDADKILLVNTVEQTPWGRYEIGFANADAGKLNLNNLKPIRITNKWLSFFGFNVMDEGSEDFCVFYKDASKMQFTMKWNGRGFYLGEPYHGNLFKYVHQLQNLYLKITGEELKSLI